VPAYLENGNKNSLVSIPVHLYLRIVWPQNDFKFRKLIEGYCGHWMIFNKILLFVSQTENRFEK
jgi:hypothetical protein